MTGNAVLFRLVKRPVLLPLADFSPCENLCVVRYLHKFYVVMFADKSCFFAFHSRINFPADFEGK